MSLKSWRFCFCVVIASSLMGFVAGFYWPAPKRITLAGQGYEAIYDPFTRQLHFAREGMRFRVLDVPAKFGTVKNLRLLIPIDQSSHDWVSVILDCSNHELTFGFSADTRQLKSIGHRRNPALITRP